MEKLKLNSGKELALIVCGVYNSSEELTVKFLPGEESLEYYISLLSSPSETGSLKLLSQAGETLAIYNGFDKLQSIHLEMEAVVEYSQDVEQAPVIGRLVTAVLKKSDRTEQRLTSLEETVDTLVLENLGL